MESMESGRMDQQEEKGGKEEKSEKRIKEWEEVGTNSNDDAPFACHSELPFAQRMFGQQDGIRNRTEGLWPPISSAFLHSLHSRTYASKGCGRNGGIVFLLCL